VSSVFVSQSSLELASTSPRLGGPARPADDTLNYITQQGVRNRVSLDLVDREFSAQLNKERNIDFALPPAK